MDFDLDLTGFEVPEIEQLMPKVHDKNVKDDDFDVNSEFKKPIFSRSVDVWSLGRHKFVCGDSTLPETYNVPMEGNKANLVVTGLL